MIKIFNPIKLDVARTNEFSTVFAKQGDCNSRFLIVTVCLNGGIINIPKNASVRLNVIRADKLGTSFNGSVMDDGRICVPVDRWVSAVAGDSRCSVEISFDEQILTTMRFTVRTEESDDVNDLGDPEIVPTDPEYDAVLAMIEDYKNGRLGVSDIFVRYSSSEDGEGFSETWSEGKNYIGIATGKSAPADKDSYIWSRFRGFDGKDGEQTPIVGEKGDSETAVMSQKAVTDEFETIESRFELSESNNRLDPDGITPGYYMRSDGTLSYGANYDLTDLFAVRAGEVITFQADRAVNGEIRREKVNFFFVTAYGGQKNVIPEFGVDSTLFSFTVPEGVEYIRLTLPSSSEYEKRAIVSGNDIMPYSEYVKPHLVLKRDFHDAEYLGEIINRTGRVIKSIKDGGTVDGKTVIEFTFTDGTVKSFSVSNGSDGLTPYIGGNGNWFIGKTDTGVAAKGEKGEIAFIWFRDDGEGNVTLGAENGMVGLTDDGEGNVNLEVK